MKNIILSPNVTRDIGFKYALAARELLAECNRRTVICPVFETDDIHEMPEGVDVGELEKELPNAELVVTFGGDGTILRAARAASEYRVPVLGVNMGGKGFMAELETHELPLLRRAAAGVYDVEERMMLSVAVTRDTEVIHEDFALNDVIIRGMNKVIDLTIFGDGHRILKFSGDGAVISTPTGSTAYSLSAGGPIVEPTARNILVTPICAHVLEAKPYVLMQDRLVTVDIGKSKQNPAYVSVDGCDSVQVSSGDMVSVKTSERITRFVRLSGKSFYSRVSEKLGEKL